MMIKTIRPMIFSDRKMPQGTKAEVITQRSIYKLPMKERNRMRVLKSMYKKRGVQGVFAVALGKWRWFNEGSYEAI